MLISNQVQSVVSLIQRNSNTIIDALAKSFSNVANGFSLIKFSGEFRLIDRNGNTHFNFHFLFTIASYR